MPEKTVSELIQSLRSIESVMPGAASRNPRAGLKKTIEFLSKHQNETVAELVGKFEFEKKSAPAKRTKSAQPLRADVVANHVDALKSAGLDNERFEVAFAQLKSDKKIRAAELKAIAKSVGFGLIERHFDHRWKLSNR